MPNNKLEFEKIYTRENCLLAYQLWEDQQTKAIINDYHWVAANTIYDVTNNSAAVYYRNDVLPNFEKHILAEIKKDPGFMEVIIRKFEAVLDKLEPVWKAKKALNNLADLVEFYYDSVQCWVGVDAVYLIPGVESAPEKYKNLSMRMRERSVDFLEDTDKIFQMTLRKLFPKLGDYIKYVTMDEVRENTIPPLSVLKKRAKHYVYYNYTIHTDVSLVDFAKRQGLLIRQEKPKTTGQVKGQVAMRGTAKGKARVMIFKKNIPDLKPGEILITTMTTPDYLPAMYKAAAFVTDEGGVTCHAAIVAREMGKPCVIGTKFATQIFKTGDMVEVDANTGIIKLIK